MSKVYYRATGSNTFEYEWVDSPEKATAEIKESAEVTLNQLPDAKLEPAPQKTQQHEPGWIISKEA